MTNNTLLKSLTLVLIGLFTLSNFLPQIIELISVDLMFIPTLSFIPLKWIYLELMMKYSRNNPLFWEINQRVCDVVRRYC